jgi:hypothetical protein
MIDIYIYIYMLQLLIIQCQILVPNWPLEFEKDSEKVLPKYFRGQMWMTLGRAHF